MPLSSDGKEGEKLRVSMVALMFWVSVTEDSEIR